MDIDLKLVLARTILGAIGNISLGLFLSPIPTIVGIHKKKSTEGFHPCTYLVAITYCWWWILYGCRAIHPNSTLVWTINSVGLMLNVFYISVFYWYTTANWKKAIRYALLVEAATTVTTILLVEKDIGTRSRNVGTICFILNIIIYGPPLTTYQVFICFILNIIIYGPPLTTYQVFKTKSSEFLPFWVCLAGFANGCAWTVYGFLSDDVNLLVGDGLGAVLSAIPLILHIMKMIFGKKSCPKGSKED